MKMTKFNNLPTFYQALEDKDFSDENLMCAGKVIVDLDLEERFGVFLLHRHFDVSENEVLAKARDGDILVTTPVSKDTPNLTPTSWCAASDAEGGVEVFEYSLSETTHDPKEVATILSDFVAAGLGNIFGIYLRDSIPLSDKMLFEVSDDDLRISLVSPWQDDSHDDGWYEQSTFTFCRSDGASGVRLTNAGIACSNTTTCYGCAPSSPMIRQAIDQINPSQLRDKKLAISNPDHLSQFLTSVRAFNNCEAQTE